MKFSRNICSKKMIKFCRQTIATGLASGIVFSSIASSASSDYCIALRGNGELKPAHWGALAQTVEVFGVPKAMSGGSSASLSTFLVESMLQNPLIGKDSVTKARDLAFMLKSLEGFVYSYTDQPKFQRFLEALKTLQGTNGEQGLISRLSGLVSNKSTSEILSSYRNIKSVLSEMNGSEVFYGAQVRAFHEAFSNYIGFTSVFSPTKWEALKKEHERLKLSLAVFGKFDAKNDTTIFVRGGVINFVALSKVFDFVANFYSLRGASPETQELMGQFIETCAPASEGMGWREIIEQRPLCQRLLNGTIQSYAKKHDESHPRRYDPIGKYLPALVSTSVVVGPSVAKLKGLRQNYNDGVTADLDIQLPSSDLKFGYWGQATDLATVSDYLTQHPSEAISQIDKSKRFMSLGSVPWGYAMQFSPAEPGLSPMLDLKANSENVISLGGWSDLHPVPILKAMGCEKIVYVTRRGGESIFAQGIAKRLLGFTKMPWSDLDPVESDTNLTQVLNNRGRVGEVDETWSAMFNLANPKSSFSVSLQMADAVVCTDWNAFDVTKEFQSLIDDAYAAPIFMPQNFDLLLLKSPKVISVADNVLVSRKTSDGRFIGTQTYPKYSGCIPWSGQFR